MDEVSTIAHTIKTKLEQLQRENEAGLTRKVNNLYKLYCYVIHRLL